MTARALFTTPILFASPKGGLPIEVDETAIAARAIEKQRRADEIEAHLREMEAAQIQRIAGRYLEALRFVNNKVDSGKAVEDTATYNGAIGLRPGPVFPTSIPGKGPCGPLCRCIDIYELRKKDGRRPASLDVVNYCKLKVSLIRPPKGNWLDQIGTALSDAGDVITDIPVIGDIAAIASTAWMAPYRASKGILDGQNLGDVFMQQVTMAVQTVKKAAPYVQTVMSFIPGIGTAASACIGFAVALANGQPIDEALLAGVKSAIPGGPIAAIAYEVGKGIISGKRIEDIGIDALPISDQAKSILHTAANLTRAVAQGANVAESVLKAAASQSAALGHLGIDILKQMGAEKLMDHVLADVEKMLPANLKQTIGDALAVGITISQAKNLQEFAKKAIESQPFINEMRQKGQALLLSNPTIAAAYNIVEAGDMRKGFEIGAAFMGIKVNTSEYLHMRQLLSRVAQKGFDMAAALHIGTKQDAILENVYKIATILPDMRENVSQSVLAGALITRGIASAHPDQKSELMAIVANHPEARAGAVLAIKAIAQQRKDLGPEIIPFWEWILQHLGLWHIDAPPKNQGAAKPVLLLQA